MLAPQCLGPSTDLCPRAAALQVYLSTESSDSGMSSGVVALDPVSTLPALLPPRLSSATGIAPGVGPYSFLISGAQQDKQGFLYLLVTRPVNQTTRVRPAGRGTCWGPGPR